MKPSFLLFSITILLSQISFAQSCLPEGIEISRQSQLDSFKILYPGCTEILGDLIIFDHAPIEITNLDSLEQITAVHGNVRMKYLILLLNFHGLHHLEHVGQDLEISNVEGVHDLSGLESLSHVGGSLNINDDFSLLNFNGLSNLTHVGDSMYFSWNMMQQDFTGFHFPDTIHGSLILNANHLENLNGMITIKHIEGDLFFRRNSGLNNLIGLDSLQTIGGDFVIEDTYLNNLEGLNSLREINGDFLVEKNDTLVSLSGMPRLQTIHGEFQLNENVYLKKLDGMENLSQINNSLIIKNSSLDTLNGFPGLKKINGWLNIQHNAQLAEIKGFEALSHVDSILIFNNDTLETISAFGDVQSVHNIDIVFNRNLSQLPGFEFINLDSTSLVRVSNNRTLSDCAIYSFCQRIASGKEINIYLNGTGCETTDEVASQCFSSTAPITDFSMQLTPNPTAESFSININPTSTVDYMLSDFKGTLLHQWPATTTSFDISDLPSGFYLFSIRTDKMIHTQKVIKL